MSKARGPLLWLALALAGAFPATGQGAEATQHDGAPAARDELMPRYLLQDPRGRLLAQDGFPGRFQLVTFGFTSCPDVCPTTLLAFKGILAKLGDKAERLQPIFITVDPERDSAAVLGEYTAAFDPRIIGLRGSPELLQRAAQSFRVRYQKVSEPGASAGHYTMDHSTGIYLLDTDGRFLAKFAITASIEDVAARIGTLMAAGTARLPASPRRNAPLR